MPPLIALVSDFGTRDHYVGAMKGVILGIAPDAVLVDVTHDIPPHDILQGALQLAACCRYFPPATIFVAIVDPGVGSARRAIAVAAGTQCFVAPDNGVLTAALAGLPVQQIVELTDRRFALPAVSRTFEGRDRFAPAAAWLARGTALAQLGAALPDYHRLEIPLPTLDAGRLHGDVLFADHFGNLVTNIDRRTFDLFAGGQPVEIRIGGHIVDALVETYAGIGANRIGALFGSTNRLEVAAGAASAAARLAIAPGASVEIRRIG